MIINEMVLFLANVLRYLFCNHDDDKNMCTFNIRFAIPLDILPLFFLLLIEEGRTWCCDAYFGGIKICWGILQLMINVIVYWVDVLQEGFIFTYVLYDFLAWELVVYWWKKCTVIITNWWRCSLLFLLCRHFLCFFYAVHFFIVRFKR